MSSNANEPSGLGGWLALVIFGMFASLVRIPWDMWRLHVPLLLDGTLGKLSDPQHPAYHPLWLPFFGVEVLANLATLVFTVGLIVLVFKRSRYAPAAAIAWYVYGLALVLGDYAMWQLIPAMAEQPVDPQFIRDLARSLLVTLVWVPYFPARGACAIPSWWIGRGCRDVPRPARPRSSRNPRAAVTPAAPGTPVTLLVICSRYLPRTLAAGRRHLGRARTTRPGTHVRGEGAGAAGLLQPAWGARGGRGSGCRKPICACCVRIMRKARPSPTRGLPGSPWH